MEEILVPIFVCVVLPVAIVALLVIPSVNSANKRAKVLIKAIEANNGIDTEQLAKSLEKKQLTPREQLNRRLQRGCLYSFLGLFLASIGIISLCDGSDLSSDGVTIPLIACGICLAIGLSNLVVYFASRKQVKD